MRALLSTTVPVQRFAVFAEMAWLERRPELGLVCRAACDHDGRLSRNTVQAVLPGLSETGADNVVGWCKVLGLCDASGGLSALGDDVGRTDQAPVPEQGVYDLWLTKHPVLGRRLLSAQRLASRHDPRFEAIEPLAVEPDRGVVFRSVLDPRERFIVRDLPSNHGQVGVLPRPTRASCELRWCLDFENERDHWQLEGRIESGETLVKIQHEPEHDGVDPWAVIEQWGEGPLAPFGRWDPATRRLYVPFERLDVDSLERFVLTLTLGAVEVPGKGGFGHAVLEDVPVGPATAADAQRWAMTRLQRRLAHEPRYRSRNDVRALFVELCQGTPLERHGPTLPSHATLIEGDLHTMRPEVFWNLAAPVDLSPHHLEAEQLGELRVGGVP
ncbi:hypothetical protein [Paraliomyxa miuraensis]|uniref:hypothetical protein n=1 Tax=Paraliomyxa miuraensis TaxID=376150 RepID=UPI002258A75F|nr:hypothetical protein [Paraliomyxa miuraensis]MCX4242515.1 hypothetical protein [Paraliomyxa miuraensis]